MKRKVLGKGLSALLPDPETDDDAQPSAGAALEVSTGDLEPNPYQPRTAMAPRQLEELSASIRESGIVQPILVRRVGSGRYQIVAGERRWRAAQALGLPRVPVIVRDIPDDRLLELALVENIQRQELTALEEAQAFKRLGEEFLLSQEQVAQRVGRDRTTVANTIRLLRLPSEVQGLLAEGRIDAGHARALLALDRVEEQVALGREAAARGLSVRDVERRVALLRAPKPASRGEGKDANTKAAEERLRAVLGTRVEIQRAGRRGHLRIAYNGEAELQRLFELLLRLGRGRA
jgi:ParB family transcriptional regulator, chromosome partitioning protein